jgi:hypothetical protein
VFGVDVPFPSIGDALYLAVYPLLIAGLVVLVRHRNPRRDRSALIDALILTTGVGLLSWVFLIAPNIHLTNQTWLQTSVGVAYPLGDVLLLAGLIRLAVDAGQRTPAFWFLVSSMVCLLATDSAYNLALLQGTYNHQLIYDAGWIFYYLFWGAAALHPSMRALEEPAEDPRTRLTPLRLALLGGACLIAPGIRFAQEIGNPDVLVLIVGSALLFLLVVARWPASSGRRRESSRASARCVVRAWSSSLRPGTTRLPRPRSRLSIACSARSPRCGSCSVSGSVAVVEASSDGATGGRVSDSTRDWLRRPRSPRASFITSCPRTCAAISGCPRARRRSSLR